LICWSIMLTLSVCRVFRNSLCTQYDGKETAT